MSNQKVANVCKPATLHHIDASAAKMTSITMATSNWVVTRAKCPPLTSSLAAGGWESHVLQSAFSKQVYSQSMSIHSATQHSTAAWQTTFGHNRLRDAWHAFDVAWKQLNNMNSTTTRNCLNNTATADVRTCRAELSTWFQTSDSNTLSVNAIAWNGDQAYTVDVDNV